MLNASLEMMRVGRSFLICVLIVDKSGPSKHQSVKNIWFYIAALRLQTDTTSTRQTRQRVSEEDNLLLLKFKLIPPTRRSCLELKLPLLRSSIPRRHTNHP